VIKNSKMKIILEIKIRGVQYKAKIQNNPPSKRLLNKIIYLVKKLNTNDLT